MDAETAPVIVAKSELGSLIGKWKLESSDKNFEDYMKAVDVGFVMRKLGLASKPDVYIQVDGEDIIIKSETTVKTNIIKFKLNEEFDEETADGRKSKTTIELKDNKLIQTQGGDVIPSTITRELQDDNTLLVTCEAKGVVCKRIYKRAA